MKYDASLLGRRYEYDPNDWKMEDALAKLGPAPSDELLDKTVREILAEGGFSTWRYILDFWRWIKTALSPTPAPAPTPTPAPTPAPTPTPAPAPASRTWDDPIQLDQGQTGHCVGFGWAGYGDSDPIEDHYENADGHAIYYEAKVIDGQPGQENGSSVRSGAKAMQNRNRIANYVFTQNIATIKQWLLTQGPIVVGTNWYNDMFNPVGAQAFVTPTGPNEGGHCYLLLGFDGADTFEFKNSWGSSWGDNGYFRMKVTDFEKLLAAQGEACAAVELPL